MCGIFSFVVESAENGRADFHYLLHFSRRKNVHGISRHGNQSVGENHEKFSCAKRITSAEFKQGPKAFFWYRQKISKAFSSGESNINFTGLACR